MTRRCDSTYVDGLKFHSKTCCVNICKDLGSFILFAKIPRRSVAFETQSVRQLDNRSSKRSSKRSKRNNNKGNKRSSRLECEKELLMVDHQIK